MHGFASLFDFPAKAGVTALGGGVVMNLAATTMPVQQPQQTAQSQGAHPMQVAAWTGSLGLSLITICYMGVKIRAKLTKGEE